jgi:hypothetical protein
MKNNIFSDEIDSEAFFLDTYFESKNKFVTA